VSIAPPDRPLCEFPFPTGHPLARTARFRCPHGCNWYRDESTAISPPAVTAVTEQGQAASRAELNRQTAATVEAFWDRVNGAIAEHVAEAHAEAGAPHQ
jgi:hypothetical protein